ncbi:MAG: hypothetical protein KIIPBIDF_01475 [Candidatus Methanoperedenaceae archaeon GB50]|nr:MAG: hypothetical protein KIIPBIDF_01475 [Candidatus Methanoperedenaceae archaeon GB50]
MLKKIFSLFFLCSYFFILGVNTGTIEEQKNVHNEGLLNAILSINKDSKKQFKKEFCRVFATTVKGCHDLKIKGITEVIALSMIEQELILAGIKSMPLSIVDQIRNSLRQACMLGYHLPKNVVNIEKTYFDYCVNCNGRREKITEIDL